MLDSQKPGEVSSLQVQLHWWGWGGSSRTQEIPCRTTASLPQRGWMNAARGHCLNRELLCAGAWPSYLPAPHRLNPRHSPVRLGSPLSSEKRSPEQECHSPTVTQGSQPGSQNPSRPECSGPGTPGLASWCGLQRPLQLGRKGQQLCQVSKALASGENMAATRPLCSFFLGTGKPNPGHQTTASV